MSDRLESAEGDSVPYEIRMDFVLKDVVFHDEMEMEAAFVPDPSRYQRRKADDGSMGWYDQFDHTFITDDAVRGLVEQMAGKPIYLQKPLIDDALSYAESRRPSVEAHLHEGRPGDSPTDASAEFLDSLAVDQMKFAILVVDIVGSTRLSQELAGGSYATAITAITTELAQVVPLFHGHVLKHTGDGLIAYFPEPSFNRMNDMALDCAMTMRAVLSLAINPALRAAGLPLIELRMGLESGEIAIRMVGATSTKRHSDLIGQVVNIAAKLQGMATPGDVIVGESMDRFLHADWRVQLERQDPPPSWQYTQPGGGPYGFFRVGRSQGSGPRRD